MNIDLRMGDCLEVLKTIPDNSVDSVITDAPYGLSFMNKKWDYDVPSKDIWEECLRVLKPGGHLLSFGGSRTYHRMAVAVEDAGFEIRDQVIWVYGSGFPKSHNVGKAIDKLQGNEREVVGERKVLDMNGGNYKNTFAETDKHFDITKGNSEWEGWGTALKPAHEDIVKAIKPGGEEYETDHPPFYYSPKASKKDRNSGLEQLENKIIQGRDPGQDSRNVPYKARPIGRTNTHPTVKPTQLMSYLIKLVTKPGGVVLDPFLGSGSTGVSAVRNGFSFIGIEREEEYFNIAKARIMHEKNQL